MCAQFLAIAAELEGRNITEAENVVTMTLH
jgi:hypothetical protein